MSATLTLDFAGEILTTQPGGVLTVGRAGDLEIDDNPYLHRDFLSFAHSDGMWWISNVGARLAAYLTDSRGLMRSTLAPGARLPLVFPRTLVTFAAGETLYELIVDIPETPYDPIQQHSSGGTTTITPGQFTESQLLALLALAEPVLRRAGSGAGEIPTTGQAAARLGWTPKRFDKKIENICDKLAGSGVRGLRGGAGGGMASNRRLHLVEYAVSTLLVSAEDLPLLDLPRQATADEDE